MSAFFNGVVGFCFGTMVGVLMLISTIKTLRSRYEQTLSSALESGQFTLVGSQGENVSATDLMRYLETGVERADATRRSLVTVGVAMLVVLGAVVAYLVAAR